MRRGGSWQRVGWGRYKCLFVGISQMEGVHAVGERNTYFDQSIRMWDELTAKMDRLRNGSFADGVMSYPVGALRFGRHVARRHGAFGACEARQVEIEDTVLKELTELLLSNSDARAEARKHAVRYVTHNPARVAGRLTASVVVSKLIPGGAGPLISLGVLYGDIKYTLEQGVRTAEGLIEAGLGGSERTVFRRPCS
jgi:hypothetical protein